MWFSRPRKVERGSIESQIDRITDPTSRRLDPKEIEAASDDELLRTIETLITFLTPQILTREARNQATENLRRCLFVAAARQLPLPLMLPAELKSVNFDTRTMLDARIDLLIAMVSNFSEVNAAVIERLKAHKRMHPWLDATGTEDARIRLEDAIQNVETTGRIARSAVDPGGDLALTTRITAVQTACKAVINDLLTPDMAQRVVELEAARDLWLDQLTVSFNEAAAGLRSQISATIVANEFGYFSNGLPYEILESQTQQIENLEGERRRTQVVLDRLIQDAPSSGAALEERLGYVVERSAELESLSIRAELVVLGTDLCRKGQELAVAVWSSYQINWDNAAALNSVADELEEVIWACKDPSRRALERRREGFQNTLAEADERVSEIRDYEDRVAWFVNIASILMGGMAMRAVTALPKVAALGERGATIVGSLAFTGTRLAVTNNQGRPWTATGIAEDAVKDYLLLRLMGGVDTRIVARVGEKGARATAARFGGSWVTLFTWTLTWNEFDPQHSGPQGAVDGSTLEVGLRTAVDLAVLTIAHAMRRAPTAPPSAELAPPDAAREARSSAQQGYKALLERLQKDGRTLEEWARAQERDTQRGIDLLSRASEAFGHMKEYHRVFESMGDLNPELRTALDGQVDAMQESIRNARDEVGMDVRQVTAESSSYLGRFENMEAYLSRLVRQGRIAEMTPEGNGVFQVHLADGQIQWFFHEGGNTPGFIDVMAESVDAAAPDVSPATRSTALEHLRSAEWPDLPTFIGGLRPGSAGEFVRWVAQPDVGAVLAERSLPAPLTQDIAEHTQFFSPLTDASVHDMVRWYGAWIRNNPEGNSRDFLGDFKDVTAWRGSSRVPSVEDAGTMLALREAAQTPTELDFTPTSQAGMWAAETVHARPTSIIQRVLEGERKFGAEYFRIQRFGAPWVLERIDGRITRAMMVVPLVGIVQDVDVKADLAALRSAMAQTPGGADEGRPALTNLNAALERVAFLLELRTGVPPEDVALIEGAQALFGHSKGANSAQLANLLNNPKVANATELQNLLDHAKVENGAQLEALLGNAKINSAVELQRMLDLHEIRDAAQLDALLASSKLAGSAQLEALLALNKVADADQLARVLGMAKVSDAALVERILASTRVVDLTQVETLLGMATLEDAARLESLLVHAKLTDAAQLRQMLAHGKASGTQIETLLSHVKIATGDQANTLLGKVDTGVRLLRLLDKCDTATQLEGFLDAITPAQTGGLEDLLDIAGTGNAARLNDLIARVKGGHSDFADMVRWTKQLDVRNTSKPPLAAPPEVASLGFTSANMPHFLDHTWEYIHIPARLNKNTTFWPVGTPLSTIRDTLGEALRLLNPPGTTTALRSPISPRT